MDELSKALEGAFHAGSYRCVLSAPSPQGTYRKTVLRRQESGWQLEQFTQTQAFHQSLSQEEAAVYLKEALSGSFRQLTIWDAEQEHAIRISKKGKVLFRSAAVSQPPKVQASHNREKRYLLPQGEDVPPLVDMGVFTKEGKVAASMQDKYRQINRFVELIDDQVGKLELDRPLTVLDFGCGKSYLTFVLYHYLTKVRGFSVEMTGLDLKEEVIQSCNAAAQRYGYDGLTFQVGDIGSYRREKPLDLVVTLHACDTATDYALFHAIRLGAGLIFSVPCCQHELAGQLESDRLGLLTRYGIIRERTAALMTDAIRGGLLEACGYRTQLIEFVDLSHTPKNLLIRGVKTRRPSAGALAETMALMEEFHLQPTLYRLLFEANLLKEGKNGPSSRK